MLYPSLCLGYCGLLPKTLHPSLLYETWSLVIFIAVFFPVFSLLGARTDSRNFFERRQNADHFNVGGK